MKYNITKELLTQYLLEKKTNREIAEIIKCPYQTIQYYIKKYGLITYQEKHKLPNYTINKIDTKEKAYLLGFICCDGAVSSNKIVELTVEKNDKEILDFIANYINCRVYIDNTYDKKNKRFPRARLSKKIPDISTFIGGDLKQNRHIPIVKEELVRYVLLGLFDADGCLTWGVRKDKQRIWQKISFTTSLSIAIGIQNILIKYLQISTIVRPKTNEKKCYVIEFANKYDVLKFLKYIYQDNFIVLHRKYSKYKALRLKLEENGEGAIKQ